jgi:aryl-alcohol dehydrogenase-like predicted oxidoreductase
MAHTRRDFLKTGIAATTMLSGLGAGAARAAAKRSATDWVTLGRSGVKVTRLGFGTGTFSGRVQRELGQEEFTRLVRHAYDRGIRFFETAQSYGGMHQMLGIALKGLPRDSYRLMTKMTVRPDTDAAATIDRFRKELQTEYFDILLLHYMHSPTWASDLARQQDEFSEAKSKKIILAKGASVHGLPTLRTFPGNQWLDIAMIRMNHRGTKMDAEDFNTNGLGNVEEVVRHTRKVHEEGMGVISMKLAGEGQFTTREERQKALKFAMGLGVVDTVTIGYKSTAEIDEAIENMDLALNG